MRIPDDVYGIRPGPVLLVCLGMLAALGAVFFGLYALRVMGLQTVDFTVCAGETDYTALSYCIGSLTRDHLKDPHWQAVQFVSYILTAMGVGALAVAVIRARGLVTVAVASAMSALAAMMIFKPAALVAWAALAGGILGGLIVDRRLNRARSEK